jgi:hypothetical protein
MQQADLLRAIFFLKKSEDLGSVISFPKSGRTWLRVMLDRLNLPMCYTHAGSEHSAGRHFKDLQIGKKALFRSRILFIYFSPRPVLFLHRDPRDTAVSGYFQKTLRLGSKNEISMANFIRDPHFGVEKIIIFNLMWLERGCKIEKFKSIGYESLRAHSVDGLASITKWLRPDSAFDLHKIQSVVQESSFQKMREQEEKGDLGKLYDEKIFGAAVANNPDSYKVRRGKVGGYTDYFSDKDLAYCDELLARYDYFNRMRELSEQTGLLQGRIHSLDALTRGAPLSAGP